MLCHRAGMIKSGKVVEQQDWPLSSNVAAPHLPAIACLQGQHSRAKASATVAPDSKNPPKISSLDVISRIFMFQNIHMTSVSGHCMRLKSLKNVEMLQA